MYIEYDIGVIFNYNNMILSKLDIKFIDYHQSNFRS